MLDDYLRHLSATGRAPATVRQHDKVLRHLAATCDPATASRPEVAAWACRPGLSPATRRHYRAVAVGWFDWLIDQDIRTDNPAQALPKPRLPRYRPHPLPEADLARALAAATPRDRAWLTLMAYAGLRCCEVVRVRGADVDLAAGRLLVRGKGGHEGVVPLHPLAAAELARWLQPGRLWPTTPAYVSQRVGGLLRSVGSSGSAHDARHRFATMLLRECHDPTVVQQAMRHASIATTMIYAQVEDQRVTSAVLALPVAA